MNEHAAARPGRPSTQLILECHGCDRALLNDPAAVVAALDGVVRVLSLEVATEVVRQARPQGVAGFVIFVTGQLSVHTWPDEGYAATDLYLHGDHDPEAGRVALAKAFGAESCMQVVARRGRAGGRSIVVDDHRRVPLWTLNARGDRIPEGIRVGRSPGRGLGLFATRDFAEQALIDKASAWLVDWNTEMVVETDLGDLCRTVDLFGYEVLPPLVESWPSAQRSAIARHYGLEDLSTVQLIQALTDDWAYDIFLPDYHVLQNHSARPTTRFDWSGAELSFDEDDRPRWVVPVRAARPIEAGEELTNDYSETLFDFVPDDD